MASRVDIFLTVFVCLLVRLMIRVSSYAARGELTARRKWSVAEVEAQMDTLVFACVDRRAHATKSAIIRIKIGAVINSDYHV